MGRILIVHHEVAGPVDVEALQKLLPGCSINYVTDDPPDPRDRAYAKGKEIVDALVEYERRNGKRWRT